MTSHSAYANVGKELTKGNGKPTTAVFSIAPIYKDNMRVFLGAYSINGSNYFKLRDIMKIFNVEVKYENGIATLDTSKVYSLSSEEVKEITPHPGAEQAPVEITSSTKPVLSAPQIKFANMPTKKKYKLGEAFDSTGFKVLQLDIYANSTNISDKYTFKSDGVDIYDGYIGENKGEQFVKCYRDGKEENIFKITVFKK